MNNIEHPVKSSPYATECNKAQRSFQPVKTQRKMSHLIFLISEAQLNFRTEMDLRTQPSRPRTDFSRTDSLEVKAKG